MSEQKLSQNKSKSQKRNERARKAQKVNAGKHGEKPKQNQDHALIKEMKAAMKDMQVKVGAFDKMKELYLKQNPAAASDSADVKAPPAPTVGQIMKSAWKEMSEKALLVPDEKDKDRYRQVVPSFHVDAMLRTLESVINTQKPSLITMPHHHAAMLMAQCKELRPEPTTDNAGGLVFGKEMLRQALMRGSKDLGYSRPMAVVLAVSISAAASSAGAAQAPVQRIRASDSGEFTYFTNLFDEYKIVDSENHFYTAITGGSTVLPCAAVAYDPQINGAFSSVEQTVVSMFHYGPFQIGNTNAFPYSQTGTGFHVFKVKMPPGPQYEYGVTTSIGTGSWTDVSTTAVDYGYFKWYFEAAGGSITTSVRQILKHKVLFRCRS